jgi:hypothetical protein
MGVAVNVLVGADMVAAGGGGATGATVAQPARMVKASTIKASCFIIGFSLTL